MHAQDLMRVNPSRHMECCELKARVCSAPYCFRVPMNLLSGKLGQRIERAQQGVEHGCVEAAAVCCAKLPRDPVRVQL